MTKDKLSGLAFHMKQHGWVAYHIGDLRGVGKTEALCGLAKEKGGEVAGRFYWESVVDGHVMAVPSEGTPHYNKEDRKSVV